MAQNLRPVQWLLDRFDVDSRWCLVHATHVDANETLALARSGAVAGLCLTTEANLGDGIFPAHDYLDAQGRIGVGSDSHIGVDWRAELRLLEYGQRLVRRQRNVLASTQATHVATRDFNLMVRRGAAVGDVDVLRGDTQCTLSADAVLLFCASGSVAVALSDAAGPLSLATDDTLWIDAPNALQCAVKGDGALLAISIRYTV